MIFIVKVIHIVNYSIYIYIPFGPTFYTGSKKLSSILIPYISENSATHPWLPHKFNSKR